MNPAISEGAHLFFYIFVAMAAFAVTLMYVNFRRTRGKKP